jgi:enamine deaminase RidA (YjgF/YER057c/UK114 family)
MNFLNPPTFATSAGLHTPGRSARGQRLVYISGQVPLDKDGQLVGAGDFGRQAEQVFNNLALALAAAGATFAEVVKKSRHVLAETVYDTREKD